MNWQKGQPIDNEINTNNITNTDTNRVYIITSDSEIEGDEVEGEEKEDEEEGEGGKDESKEESSPQHFRFSFPPLVH